MSQPILGRGLSSLLPQNDQTPPRVPVEPPIATQGVFDPSLQAAPSGETSPEAPGPRIAPGKESVFYIDLGEIQPNPHQPRKDFNNAELGELAESIREHGILQPLIVTKHDHPTPRGREVTYEIIAGERRWRAASLAGLKHVPVIIRDSAGRQKLEMALVENIQRHDLNSLEEAAAFKKLADEFGLSQDEIAKKIGKSRAAVANTMRLLTLPQEAQKMLLEGRISEGHARAMLGLHDPLRQLAVLKETLDKNLSVREVEEIVRATQAELGLRRERAARSPDPEVRELESKLEEALGTKVALRGKPNRGKIVVEFYSREDLNRILEKLSDQKIQNPEVT